MRSYGFLSFFIYDAVAIIIIYFFSPVIYLVSFSSIGTKTALGFILIPWPKFCHRKPLINSDMVMPLLVNGPQCFRLKMTVFLHIGAGMWNDCRWHIAGRGHGEEGSSG